MTRKSVVKSICCLAVCVLPAACEKKFNPTDGAAPPAQTIPIGDMSLVTVDKPEPVPVGECGSD